MSTKINIYTTSGLFTLTAGDNDVEAVELVKNTYQIIMTRKRARKICRQFGVTIFVNAFQCTIPILKYFAKFLFCFHDFSVISFELMFTLRTLRKSKTKVAENLEKSPE